MNVTEQTIKALGYDPQQQFPLSVPGQPNYDGYGGGACIPNPLRGQWAALSVLRFDTAYYTLTNGAAGTPWVLTIANASKSMFAAGIDGAAGGLGGVAKPQTDTNLYKDGALVGQGKDLVFRALGMAVSFGRPFFLTGSVKAYDAAVDPYVGRIIEAMTDGLALEVTHGDESTCKYRLGTPRFLPQIGGPVGGGTPTIGQPFGVSFVPFAAAEDSGGRDDADKMQVSTSAGYQLEFNSDAASPTPEETDLIVPMQVAFIGYPRCRTASDSGCAPAAPVMAGEIEALRAEVRRLGGKV